MPQYLRETDYCLNEPSDIFTRYFNACGIPLASPCVFRPRIPTITQHNSCILTQDYINSFSSQQYVTIYSQSSMSGIEMTLAKCFRLHTETNVLPEMANTVGLRSFQAAVNECPSSLSSMKKLSDAAFSLSIILWSVLQISILSLTAGYGINVEFHFPANAVLLRNMLRYIHLYSLSWFSVL